MSQLEGNASSGNGDGRLLGKRCVLLQTEGWKAGMETGSPAEGKTEVQGSV